MNADDEVCLCFHVSQRKIVNFVRVHQPRRASLISECGGAGTGCGWCIPFLKRYHAALMEGNIEEADDITPAEYARRRAAYVRAGGGTPPAGATPIDDADSPGRPDSACD